MATDHKSHVVASAPRTRPGAAAETEVYGMLGALLGTLEVVASDDAAPLSPVQATRMRTAVRLCYGLQHQVEALLTLAADELELRRHHSAVRPLVEHAVHGALRSFEMRGITLRLPAGEAWGALRVFIDPSRVDRMLKALVEALAGSVGQNGAVEVGVEASGPSVVLTLRGQLGEPLSNKAQLAEPTLQSSSLLLRGAARLFELLGGGFTFDVQALVLSVQLPASEAA